MPLSQGYRRHVEICNRHDLTRFVPFYIEDRPYGWIEKKLASLLLAQRAEFTPHAQGIMLAPAYKTFDARSEALAQASQSISQHYGVKLRREMYPVVGDWGDEPLAQIDRAAVPWFGIRAFGVHINGYVRKPDGIHLWIGERAADRIMDPGKLDNLVGGGQPIGLTLEDNICKEAQEEAGIDAAVARRAQPVGRISYRAERKDGLRSDTLFVYDLELPADFTPRNMDGEVAAFQSMPLAAVAALVHDTDRFKFNCNLVIIDFLMRHGFIGPADEEYAALKERGLGAGDGG